MRYLLTISYDGENYNGWQHQNKGNTIQDVIEEKLKILLKENVSIVASGRTDAKVNAYAQKAHFDTEKSFDEQKFLRSLNGLLPQDIKCTSIEKSDVHARFSAKKKTYLYKMYISNIDLPLYEKHLRVNENTNISKLKMYAKMLCGTHDFKNLAGANTDVKNTVRHINKAKFVKNKNLLYFYITGNGFLYKMVRNIVGLLLYAERMKMDKKTFYDYAFITPHAKKTAPGENLFLFDVEYK